MKYRIVLLFDVKDEKRIINLNQKVNKNISADIDFSKQAISHITLASGYIQEENFNKVCELIQQTIDEFLSSTLVLQTKRLSYSEDLQWLFIDIKNNQMLENFTDELRRKIENIMEMSSRKKTHITVAKSKNLNKNYQIINSLKIPNKIKISKIAIGESGDNGTFINIFEEFNIDFLKIEKIN